MSDGEPDGGEIRKVSWVGSASDSSSDSDQDIILMLPNVTHNIMFM